MPPVIARPSPNHAPRPAGMPIDMLVLHYTGMRDAGAAIGRLCDPEAAVSSHYVIDEAGAVHRLVEEGRRAAHAGVSHWRGIDGLNDRSIGIEIVNPGHEWGYRPFPPAQVEAVMAVSRDIIARHAVPACNVVGHSDVAPDRKQDPGELFPWRALASGGIGFWPDDAGLDVVDAAPADAPPGGAPRRRIGYQVDAGSPAATLASVITAFQRHWRPARVDGIADLGTWRMVDAVARGLSDQAPGAKQRE